MLSNNLFAYCSNNPVNFLDPTGMAKEWVKLGFKYDGSARDFYRMEHGLSPIAYENWLSQGSTAQVDKVVQQEGSIKRVMKKVTYIPPNKTKDKYIEKSKKSIGPNAVDGVSLAAGILTSVPKVANKIPYIGPAFIAFDVIRFYIGILDKYDLEAYQRVMNQGAGVLVVVWSIEGAPSGNGTYTSYHSWNGVGNPFESR